MTESKKNRKEHIAQQELPSLMNADPDATAPFLPTVALSADSLLDSGESSFPTAQMRTDDISEHTTPLPIPPTQAIQEKILEPKSFILNRYDVIKKIGEGGMGALYQIHDRQTKQIQALKLLQDSHSSKTNAIERFRREIEALRRFDHPHIVKVSDAGKIDDIPYYTMEYLPNGTLRQRLRQHGPLSWIQALHLMERIVDAIAHIHSFDLIHRDLKSDNIMFRKTGAPVITDLGLSLILGQDDSERLTARGYFVGTVHYMAPEQAINPNAVDERCDIYALGMLFYEMLTGDVPFAKKSGIEALKLILKGKTPPLHTYDIKLPKSIIALCEKAMAHNPAERFASTAMMLQALRLMLQVLQSSSK